MTFNQNFIEKKLVELKKYYREIESFFQNTDNKILRDTVLLHNGERLLQLSVDTMIDINQHFIKELNLKTSDDFQGTFLVLAENKILPEVFAEKIALVVGLRNRIVHRYETIKKKLFISSFRKDYQDFNNYIAYIYKYLKQR